ncbi:hypothetical protein [Bacillus sp. FJAT-49736]|uniref:hypothetical protein n=1 Tax=Bacillus sp. FJAT-49736 TaxID=2833582 RepID=UPI001BC93960|nr:hypothetical protein [Bacillus sp. FJAT-49736]MBS4172885.1 hypothetical protein [Bacillus sp. FJAT-49736]
MLKAMIGFYILAIIYSVFGAAYSVMTGHIELVTVHVFVGLISAGLLALVNMEKKKLNKTVEQ